MNAIPPELREEVARVIAIVEYGDEFDQTGLMFDHADAAIAAVLAWVEREFVAIERLT